MQRRSFLYIASVLLLAGAAWSDWAAAQSAKDNTPSQSTEVNAHVLTSQQALSVRLLRLLRMEGGTNANTVVSPASLASVMSMLALGADEKMQAAIRRSLGFSRGAAKSEVASDLSRIRSIASDVTARLQNSPFKIANAIIFDPASRPHEIALFGLRSLKVEASVENLSNPQTIAKINAWVKRETSSLILSIIDEPPTNAGLIALNALYFKDRWRTPFDPLLTKAAPFRKADGTTTEVQMMTSDASRLFRQNERLVAVDLSYATKGFSLVVVTTKRGSAPLKLLASGAAWLGGEGFAPSSGELRIPRFVMSNTAQLLPALDRLGLAPARFSPSALAGLSPIPQRIARVSQKTFLAVDEAGTEAAAATAVVTSRSANGDFVKMNVDKPFLFAIRDTKSGLILLAGYVADPSAKSP